MAWSLPWSAWGLFVAGCPLVGGAGPRRGPGAGGRGRRARVAGRGGGGHARACHRGQRRVPAAAWPPVLGGAQRSWPCRGLLTGAILAAAPPPAPRSGAGGARLRRARPRAAAGTGGAVSARSDANQQPRACRSSRGICAPRGRTMSAATAPSGPRRRWPGRSPASRPRPRWSASWRSFASWRSRRRPARGALAAQALAGRAAWRCSPSRRLRAVPAGWSSTLPLVVLAVAYALAGHGPHVEVARRVAVRARARGRARACWPRPRSASWRSRLAASSSSARDVDGLRRPARARVVLRARGPDRPAAGRAAGRGRPAAAGGRGADRVAAADAALSGGARSFGALFVRSRSGPTASSCRRRGVARLASGRLPAEVETAGRRRPSPADWPSWRWPPAVPSCPPWRCGP